jgi:hypothetical protein
MCHIFYVIPTCGHAHYSCHSCLVGESLWLGHTPPQEWQACPTTDLYLHHRVITPTLCANCIMTSSSSTSLSTNFEAVQRAAFHTVVPLCQVTAFYNDTLLSHWDGRLLPDVDDVKWLISATKRVDIVLQMAKEIEHRADPVFNHKLRTLRAKLRRLLLILINKVEVNISDRVLFRHLAFLPREITPIPLTSVDEEHKTCSICVVLIGEISESGDEAETAVRTSCNHIFGSRCLESWFLQNRTCPLCRHEFPGTTQTYCSIFENFQVLQEALSLDSPRREYFTHKSD